MLRENTATQRSIAGLLLCGALGVSACAPAQPPTMALSQAEAAVEQARESKASLYAPTELRLARENLDSARLALNAGEYERARRLAEQALADARIAEARAETENLRQTARDLRLTITTLRDEAARASVASLPPLPPTELRLARENLDSARLALDVGEYERAHRLATQALADARIAEARAATENLRYTARELRLSSETVRDTAARLAALY
jgi:hypothetical protein